MKQPGPTSASEDFGSFGTEWHVPSVFWFVGGTDPGTYAKLSNALTLLMGIDPVVVMRDIAGVSREEALDTLEWCGRTLVEAALRDEARTRRR